MNSSTVRPEIFIRILGLVPALFSFIVLFAETDDTGLALFFIGPVFLYLLAVTAFLYLGIEIIFWILSLLKIPALNSAWMLLALYGSAAFLVTLFIHTV
jgi:hypothetical protein